MDLEVVEITPPPVSSRSSKRLKRKQVILHENYEIIDVDEDESSADTMMILDMKIGSSNKGKAIKSNSNALSSHQSEDTFTVNGIEPTKSFAPGSNYSINLGSHGSNSYHDADNYTDFYTNDIINVDDYDIPFGLEAPPWCPVLAQLESKTIAPNMKMMSDLGLSHMDPYPSLWPPGSAQFDMKSGSSVSVINPPGPGMELPSPFLGPPFLQNSSGSSLNHVPAMKIPHVAENPPWMHGFPNHVKKLQGSNLPYTDPSQMGPLNHHHPGVYDPFNDYWDQKYAGKRNKKSGAGGSKARVYPNSGSNGNLKDVMAKLRSFKQFDTVDDHLDHHYDQEYSGKRNKKSGAGGSKARVDPNSGSDGTLEDVMAKFRSFKQFDTVDDHSDHHYAQKGYSMKQPSKVWAKRIQEEWKILEKDLPDTIFVRVYESRMDILRAVIQGAEGTPYHDGLFFFDVFFPSEYPNIPPHVHYHAGGLRLNPNLYACGKVCLSLLNTWSGNKNEKWIPGTSSMLQVLVSIQGLILNSKPYFNEPGYANTGGTPQGEIYSLKYNEDTFLLSLRTMSFTMRKPPKHFEDFVAGHFCERAHDILVACKAYIDGAQVGCLVKGGVQDVDEGDKSCSDAFKKNVAQYLNVLVTGFKNIGAKD